MKRRWAIPGKVMLAGEYSVLREGGIALVLAVDAGLELELEPPSASQSPLPVRRDTAVAWSGGPVPDELRFLHAGLAHSAPKRLFKAPFRVQLSSSPSAGVGTGATKPGLGGSASAAVGGLAVGYRLAGLVPSREVFLQAAVDVHRTAQAGRGSGYDVAAVAMGGLSVYQVDRISDGPGGRLVASAVPRPVPRGWSFCMAYAGRSASTTRLVGRLDALGPAAREDALIRLGASVRPLVDALGAGARAEVVNAVRHCDAALREFDALTGVGVYTPEVDALLAVAHAMGCPCKVSGAGGGDSVVAFDREPDRLLALRSAWTASGFHTYSPPVARRGAWDAFFGPGDAPTDAAPSLDFHA